MQRVTESSVTVDEVVVASIGAGLVVLVGVGRDDSDDDAAALAAKLVGLRVFADDEGKMNLSVADIGGSVLVVSQFTLMADVGKGRRPSFVGAADPAHAEPLVQVLADLVAAEGIPTATGSFGATMEVRLVNEGPVTIVIETRRGRVL